jgi:chromosome segregation ATPase
MIEAELEQRLIALRNEYESGQKIMEDLELKLAQLQKRKTNLAETLLRISGAIDLLEEVLGKSDEELQVKDDAASAGIGEVP